MNASFFDSNTLLWLASDNRPRIEHVEALTAAGGTISVQVLNEVVNVGRKKFRIRWEQIHLLIGQVRSLLDVVPLTLSIHEHGVQLAQRHNFSTYDAMIVSAALAAGCETLWSEDMQHGMPVDGRLTIRNPFLG